MPRTSIRKMPRAYIEAVVGLGLIYLLSVVLVNFGVILPLMFLTGAMKFIPVAYTLPIEQLITDLFAISIIFPVIIITMYLSWKNIPYLLWGISKSIDNNYKKIWGRT